MRFSWKWLSTLVELKNMKLHEVFSRLTLAGIEIENIEDKPEIEDKIITISVTANRSDVSCMIGLAREISTIFKIDINSRPIEIYKNEKILPIQSSIAKNSTPHSLLNISICTIKELKSNLSPLWLKNYLKGCDIIPSNLCNDIAEYINLKWGQDINIFDTSKIDGKFFQSNAIKIRNNYSSNDLINEIDFYQLAKNKHVNVLEYKNFILSVIGISSNPNFICNIKTNSILILGQICSTSYVQELTVRKRYQTNKSNKHLKGISREDFIYAYAEAVHLIQKLSKGKIEATSGYYAPATDEKTIKIRKRQINNTLGITSKQNKTKLNAKKTYQLLKQLNFQPKYNNDNVFVKVPEYRIQDLKRSIDIIEEIGRIYGFEKFIDEIPNNKRKGNLSPMHKLIQNIRYKLRSMGMHEIINYSLQDKLKPNSSNCNINLYNPLLQDQSQLRSNLITNLLDTKSYNLKNNNLCLECFEIGRVFYTVNSHKIERLHIAGIVGKSNFSRISWADTGKPLNWFHGKGMLEELFETLKIDVNWMRYNVKILRRYQEFFHPHRSTIITSKRNKQIIGIFGQISSKYKKLLNYDHNTYIFELNLLELVRSVSNKSNKHLNHTFKPYYNYPSVTRDISLQLSRNETAEMIIHNILVTDNSLIETIEVIDEYINYSKKIHERNLTLRVKYRAKDRTLNDKDLEFINNKIQNLLQNRRQKM